MAKYKAYPEYKDSGVEWLGEIPTHWICTQVKYGYDITLGKMLQKNKSSSKDELKPYLKAQNIQPTGIDLSVVDNMWFSPDEKSKLLLKNNDVLISEGGDVGRSALWQGQLDECYIQNAINRARAINGNSPYFLNYWMIYLKSADFINTLCNKATIAHYTAEKVETSPLLLPDSDEQLHISLFLAHETAKIDKLIEKQQQLIELLKEKRQTVISHAVTKGLNPDVPMKDSGVEWLGEVPEHWKLIKFSHCVSIRSGQVDPRKFPYCDYWLIAPNHIVSGEGRIINLETAKDQGADSGKYLCRTGEVIYSKIRPALVKACLSPSDTVLCSADMYPMTSYNGLTNNFLLLYLLSDVFTRFAVNQADRVAMPKINRESLSDCKIPVPPIDEQEKICSHAREALEKLDVLLQKSQLTIEIFQERRTALISAAVTGKIDVRDWVAPDTQDIEASQEATA
ncbi:MULTISPECIES: restriction endonuclease subunit S [Klebsiella]|uniref:restriction endonuclease subunit S n=1 Tax=Klebsiella TaxID=570 RepID=UPI000E2C2585|nr:restriction endonuclease subunit S [Klebsiella variicola]HCB0021706.1 restriction endonuclease subunit S [Klebsiella variicola subsp. variicola]MBG1746393.1 restriction endonuclease subunit S [Klebsiella variicola]MBK4953318.1 restriction endonuclease subunit S [Klebsiella variicola]SXE84030.1 putative restriction endonuclease S subunit [Klebsiella variicola]HBZ5589791.1 restriction endonuclease subunit S [Klebsiella variicola]